MSTSNDHGPWDPQDGQQYGQPSPYGQTPGGDQQFGQPSPYGPPPQHDQQGASQDPFGPPASADPYGQSSGASASDPYGQSPQNWSPADGSASQPSDPYGQGGPQQGPGGQVPPGAAQGVVGEQGQSRLLVGLMGIFFGGLGVHRFLMGYTTIGLVQVLVSVLSCFTLYPFIQIWGLIEGIMVLAKSPSFERDAHGRPLAD